jgi:hypothetical protein
VWGNLHLAGSGSLTATYAGLTTTAGTIPNVTGGGGTDRNAMSVVYQNSASPFTSVGWITQEVGVARFSLSATTVVYLNTYDSFGTSLSAFGKLSARRVR